LPFSALANGPSSPMHPLAELVLTELLTPSAAYQVALAPAPVGSPAAAASATGAGGPWPATLAAADAVNVLLKDWDDVVADALFTENVALDRPYPERLGDLALLRDRIGAFD